MVDRSPEKQIDYFSRRESSSEQTPRLRRTATETLRPRLGNLQTPISPTSPRTPRTPLLGRSISSTFGSPGLGFRQDDECLILELTERHLRAGLAGETAPRCELNFGPRDYGRAGTAASPIPALTNTERNVPAETYEKWGQSHELWPLDLREADLDVIGDKLERSLRDALRDYILVLDDSKKRKAMLIVPPAMAHPLLPIICSKLFDLYPPPPSITLLSPATLCAVSAGVRSALVVDIGWSTTTVSAIYDYRQVKHRSSTRALKLLSWHFRELLRNTMGSAGESSLDLSFNDVEEAVSRMAWCSPSHHSGATAVNGRTSHKTKIHLTSIHPLRTLHVPFFSFAEQVESAFLSSTTAYEYVDDEELHLPFLMYSTLLSLAIDVRAACLERVIFSGRGASIPGLRSRLLSDLEQLIAERGWDAVQRYGSAEKPPNSSQRLDKKEPLAKEALINLPSRNTNKDIDGDTAAPAHLQPPLPDPVMTKIRNLIPSQATNLGSSRERATDIPDLGGLPDHSTTPEPRILSSLGAWTGASLLAGLRIPGHVEIEREHFLQHGLLGRPTSTADEKRRSMPAATVHKQGLPGQGGGPSRYGDHVLTLGLWA